MIRSADPSHVVASFPAAGTQDFYVSGFAEHTDELGGTASITDEPAGSGRVVLFASEPNFRGYTTGTQKVLWNALFGADPWHARAARARSSTRADAERTAVAAARSVTTAGFSGIRLTVRAARAARARRVLGRLGARYRVEGARGRRTFLVANRGGAESRLALRLPVSLKRSHVPVVAFVVR